MAAEEETAREREELRALVGQLRTNIAARGRSGLLGVALTPAGARRRSRSRRPCA